MDRISIIGTSGSGKTTLARRLSHLLDIPCVELDAINWRRGDWREITRAELSETVSDAVCQEQWVIEGSYSAVRPLIWGRADTVVWLDYPLHVTFARLLRRTAHRVISQVSLWGGCRESLALTLTRDSILLWCLKTHGRNRRKFAEQMAQSDYQHLRVLRFRTPRQTKAWLAGLTPKSAMAIPDR